MPIKGHGAALGSQSQSRAGLWGETGQHRACEVVPLAQLAQKQRGQLGSGQLRLDPASVHGGQVRIDRLLGAGNLGQLQEVPARLAAHGAPRGGGLVLACSGPVLGGGGPPATVEHECNGCSHGFCAREVRACVCVTRDSDSQVFFPPQAAALAF